VRIIAYIYTDPLIESSPEIEIWEWEIDRVYQDLGGRDELDRLCQDCLTQQYGYLLVRQLDELGDSVRSVQQVLVKLHKLGVELITTETDIAQQLNLLQLIDKIQSNHISRRMRQGHARNRLKSLPPPGKAPYGYRRSKDKYPIDRRHLSSKTFSIASRSMAHCGVPCVIWSRNIIKRLRLQQG
jgi:DNA invertase Pin-like site-specific DNA recombinase